MESGGWVGTGANLRVLSLREASDSWIRGWATVVFTTVHKQRLVPEVPEHVGHRVWWFADTTDPSDDLAVSEEQVAEIIEEGRRLTPADRLIVHCHGGMNRSPAAALAVLLATGTQPADATDLVRRIRPIANPNPLVVARIEALLDVDLAGPLRDAGLSLQGDDPRWVPPSH